MNFVLTEPGKIDRALFENTLDQWVSFPHGRWWIHCNRMIYGVRICVGLVDPSGYGMYEAVYCAGAHTANQFIVLGMVMLALADVPEEITAEELHKRMPLQRVKPMQNDPECWRQLCELGGRQISTEAFIQEEP